MGRLRYGLGGGTLSCWPGGLCDASVPAAAVLTPSPAPGHWTPSAKVFLCTVHRTLHANRGPGPVRGTLGFCPDGAILSRAVTNLSESARDGHGAPSMGDKARGGVGSRGAGGREGPKPRRGL